MEIKGLKKVLHSIESRFPLDSVEFTITLNNKTKVVFHSYRIVGNSLYIQTDNVQYNIDARRITKLDFRAIR